MVGIAETGSGKTLAYIIPAILHCLFNKVPSEEQIKIFPYTPSPYVLILVPTRELANQVYEILNIFSSVVELNAFLLIGGLNKWDQINELKNKSHLIS